jgi:uncharacterized protein (TIGR02145 family)
MNHLLKNSGLILLILIIYSCKKDSPTLAISTRVVTKITSTSAVAGGINTVENGDTVTARGFCWAWELQEPGIGHTKTTEDPGTGRFISNITGLTGNTTYYLRAYASSNYQGEPIYGNVIEFKTQIGNITFNPDLTYGSVIDVDGNTYKTIEIGTQTWMAENLRTTKYNDGSDIFNVTDNKVWTQLTTQAYCWYNNDETNKSVYGALYNAMTLSKLCPVGWHVPSYDEWKTLTSFLDGLSFAGSKLKEEGTAHWFYSGADNYSGFSAVGGGSRNSATGTFDMLAWDGCWWSTFAQYVPHFGRYFVYTQEIYSSSDNVSAASRDSKSGLSIRCIKDN